MATFAVPQTLDAMRKEIRDLSAAIGEVERGEALVREMDAELAALAPSAHKPPLRVVALRPSGFTVAKGSLADELMTRAALDNTAAPTISFRWKRSSCSKRTCSSSTASVTARLPRRWRRSIIPSMPRSAGG